MNKLKEFVIDNIKVIFNDFADEELTEAMAKDAIQYAEENKEVPIAVISEIIIDKTDEGTKFTVKYNDEDQLKIGRIRRITG